MCLGKLLPKTPTFIRHPSSHCTAIVPPFRLYSQHTHILNFGLNGVLNVKAIVGTFNQEKALVGALSVITNLRVDLRLKL